jgi:hypothetical protein
LKRDQDQKTLAYLQKITHGGIRDEKKTSLKKGYVAALATLGVAMIAIVCCVLINMGTANSGTDSTETILETTEGNTY